jgi:hypothetical protein
MIGLCIILRARPAWSPDARDFGASLPSQSDIPRWHAGGVNGAPITVASDRVTGERDQYPSVRPAPGTGRTAAGLQPS